jgi:hypothetical protein
MYPELYRYFIQHKNLHLPGIGSFILDRKPAEADFINKCIQPPEYSVLFLQDAVRPSSKFYSWLAAAVNISEKEAIIRFNDFIFDLRRQLNEETKVDWKGMGTISKGPGGSIRFVKEERKHFLRSVPAEKIIREKTEHAVLVGERERSSAEMMEYFSNPTEKKNYWWLLPLSAVLLTFMFTGWHFSKRGVNISSLGNTNKLSTIAAGETYKQLR